MTPPDPSSARTAPAAGFGANLARSWTITYPLIVGSLSSVLLTVVDTAILGRYSTEALAVVALASPLFVLASSLIVPWGTAVQVLVARWHGAQDDARIGRLVDIGLVCCLAVGVTVAVVFAALAVPLVWLVGGGSAPAGSAEVVAIYAAALPATAVTAHYRGFFGGLGKTRIAMQVALLVNLVNIPLDYLLVFGLDLGAVGSAWGTVLATFTGAALVVALGRRRLGRRYPFWRRENLRGGREIAASLNRIGWPDVAFAVLVYGADVVLVTIVAGFGTEEPLAGYRLMVATISVVWVMVFGCSSGIAILAGQRLGAEDPDGALAYMRSGAALMVLLAVVVALPALLAPQVFFGLFSADGAVVTEAGRAALLLVVIIPAMVAAMSPAGVLRAAGDTKSILYAGALGQVVLALPVAWGVGWGLGHGLTGVYAGFAAGVLARAVFTWARFRRGRWRNPPERPA